MKTRTDLVNQALIELGKLETGQDVAPEDAALVDSLIDGKFMELARRQVLYVQNSNAIDEEYFLPLAKIVANASAPGFGIAYDEGADAREEARLRRINRGPGVYETMRADYI